MIPHLTLSDEIFGSDLKDRVMACRNRLRLKRIQRSQSGHHPGELFSDSIQACEVLGHSEEDAAGQEVGIT